MTNEVLERLRKWSQDKLHIGQSVRTHEPVYPNPAALRADVRELIAAYEMPSPDELEPWDADECRCVSGMHTCGKPNDDEG